MSKLSEAQQQALNGKNLAYLATVNSDGSPQVTPVWFAIEGETLIMNTAAGRLKERNLRRDPRVMVAVNDPANPIPSQVLVRGRAELIEEGAKETIDRLAKKYLGVDEYPWHRPGEQRVTIKVVPEPADGESEV